MFCSPSFFLLLFKIFIYLFLERGKGSKRGREIPMCGCFSRDPMGDLACNPGMCPDWELNQCPLVRRLALNPLSHTSHSCSPFLLPTSSFQLIFIFSSLSLFSFASGRIGFTCFTKMLAIIDAFSQCLSFLPKNICQCWPFKKRQETS